MEYDIGLARELRRTGGIRFHFRQFNIKAKDQPRGLVVRVSDC